MFRMNDFLRCGTVISTVSGRVLLGYGRRTWLAALADSSEPQFYFPDFFCTLLKPWFTHTHYCEMDIDELLRLLPHSAVDACRWGSPDKTLFLRVFEDLKRRFALKELQKAVPYVFETTDGEMTPDRLVKSLHSLLTNARAYPLHVYGFWDERQGMLGGTPEMLFTIEKKIHRMLKTVACAGTSGKGQQILLNGSKERLEHQLVIDDLLQVLAEFGSPNIGETVVVQFPGLSHLVTPITVDLSAFVSMDRIVQALHPTAALGAFPRKAGRAWLDRQQKMIDRGRYGAPAGYVHNGDVRCYVAIRNAQWDERGIALGAGCGVISASECEKEWIEIQLKLNAIKRLLNL